MFRSEIFYKCEFLVPTTNQAIYAFQVVTFLCKTHLKEIILTLESYLHWKMLFIIFSDKFSSIEINCYPSASNSVDSIMPIHVLYKVSSLYCTCSDD